MARVPDLLTVEALAAKWSLRPGTIRAWARRGKIPSRKMGRLIVFNVEELVEWFEHLPSGATCDDDGGVNP